VADVGGAECPRPPRFGRSTQLKVDGRPRRRAYLRFAVSLPAGATVSGVSLRLKPVRRRAWNRVRVHTVRGAWREATLAYGRAPRIGQRLGVSSRPAKHSYQRLRLPPRLLASGRVTLALSARSRWLRRFGSRESRRPPRLVVSYSVPPQSPPTPAPTPPPPAAAAVAPIVLAAGDIQPAGATENPTEAILDATPYDALLALGDNQYDSGTLAEYNAYYAQTWGSAAHQRRTFPVPGNHELDAAGNYCSYFRTGANGPAAVDPCPGGRRYYSFDLGSWHLVAMDSSSGTIDLAQREWLRSDLAAHPVACTLAFWHHPRYAAPSMSSDLGGAWTDLMNGGVDVALVGHEHNYQRFGPMDDSGGVDAARGVREFVVGTGGASLHVAAPSVPGREATNSETMGVLRLALSAGSYDWRFLPVAGATFTDAGKMSCH
jgi:acid phosphatase type 7